MIINEKNCSEKREMHMEEKKEHHRLVIDGNSFYELDLDCVREKQKARKQPVADNRPQQKRQRR
jgi:hypothetical protein